MSKIQEYSDYINEHVANVQKVWKGLRALINTTHTIEKGFTIHYDCRISDLIEAHDRSKFSKQEFEGYRQWFYSDIGEDKSGDLMNVAWNHHQKTNPHHWQYWLMWRPEGTIVLDMPLEYVIEMLCDWTAMSIKFNNDPAEWYEGEKGKMLLSSNTKDTVEDWLPLFSLVAKDFK